MKLTKKTIVLSTFILGCMIAPVTFAASTDDLITAVIRDNASSVQSAIKKGALINARDAKGRTALTAAIQLQSQKAVAALLQSKNIDVNATNNVDESPLMLAIISGQDDLAKQLIQKGAHINKKGWTPLHYAATKGNVPMLKLLLERDAYIDAHSPNRTTPLMMAAQYGGNAKAVELLLQNGSDPWMKNQQGNTALDFAKRGNNPEIIRIIQTAQKNKKPNYNAKAIAPLSAASAAELKGLPIESAQEPELIYPRAN